MRRGTEGNVWTRNRKGWRNLQIEELHNLYSSHILLTAFELRRMIWAEHVACTRKL
jgi:hypothetical protein